MILTNKPKSKIKLKKTAITIVLITTTFLTMYSQISFNPGIKIGYNNTKIENVHDNNRKGFYAGVFGELYFNSIGYALQPEISYSQQGTENYNQDFFIITLANKIYLVRERFYVVIGPSLDLKLNGTKEIVNEAAGTRIKLETDYSAFGGFGFHFPFGLGIEARWKFSFKDEVPDGFGNSIGKNYVTQIGLTYKFDLEKWF